MVSGQRRAGEVVEAPGARLAPVALPTRLRVVAPVADHRIAAAAGAAHALGPAVLAHQREALGVVQQRREADQIDGCHDGGGSSHEPVSYSRPRPRPSLPSAPRPGPDLTTPEADKSPVLYQSSKRARLDGAETSARTSRKAFPFMLTPDHPPGGRKPMSGAPRA